MSKTARVVLNYQMRPRLIDIVNADRVRSHVKTVVNEKSDSIEGAFDHLSHTIDILESYLGVGWQGTLKGWLVLWFGVQIQFGFTHPAEGFYTL